MSLTLQRSAWPTQTATSFLTFMCCCESWPPFPSLACWSWSNHHSGAAWGRTDSTLAMLKYHRDVELNPEEVVQEFALRHPRRMLLDWSVTCHFSWSNNKCFCTPYYFLHHILTSLNGGGAPAYKYKCVRITCLGKVSQNTQKSISEWSKTQKFPAGHAPRPP